MKKTSRKIKAPAFCRSLRFLSNFRFYFRTHLAPYEKFKFFDPHPFELFVGACMLLNPHGKIKNRLDKYLSV